MDAAVRADVYSDAPVHIVEANGRITDGIGFESDQNLEHYRILHPVIVTPSGAFQSGPRTNENTLKPQTQAVPGAGAIQATRPIPPLSDTVHH